MKKLITSLVAISLLVGCQTSQSLTANSEEVTTIIDLVNVENDQVKVTIDFPEIKSSSVEFRIPKTVPGTYSNDNYGRFIEDFKAYDYKGNEMYVTKIDENTWNIPSAKYLDKVAYKVNDTYDFEKEGGVFSPTGTNIEKDKNFMLNLHGFVGYIPAFENHPYTLKISRPKHLYPGTALKFTSKNLSATKSLDQFKVGRYFEVTDNPIMYAMPDTISFHTSGMEILLSVYSANGKYKAEDFRAAMEKTMKAQKDFLGPIDNTDKYAILLYLSDDKKKDARGTGALEHNNSTVATFPESMDHQSLENVLIDVVSHEFFHILTPLNVHSKEIHYFDFNNPKMSKHLWMYEGVTEYFANLFQIKQGLIDEKEFYQRMTEKINISKNYDDHLPFTFMSQNILKEPYHDMFYNVYQKGALIAMCLDIQLRESSKGEMGILELMQKLSHKYGKDQPFDDHAIIQEMTAMTYPEIREFFKKYVEGNQAIPYHYYLNKVGLDLKENEIETSYLIKKKAAYVDLNPTDGSIYFKRNFKFNNFLNEMGVKPGDVLKAINGKSIHQENFRNMILETRDWKPNMEVSFLIQRDGKELLLKGNTIQPKETEYEIVELFSTASKTSNQTKTTWLKG